MSLYESDLRNLEKRNSFRTFYVILENVFYYLFIFLVLAISQSILGYWLALIPTILSIIFWIHFIKPKIENWVDKTCKDVYPMSYELLSEIRETTKTSENSNQ